MNPLTKTAVRRGKGAPRSNPSSARAAGTYAPVAGSAGTRAEAGGTGVPQDDGGSRIGASPVASPVGGWWPTSSTSEG